ncbi:MAG: phosphoribosylanthranilate isomerase [Neisseriaceae bacterium]
MSFSTRIKICGITRLEDALDCVELGVDALGFVFARSSRRYVTPEHAYEIIKKLPPFVTTVGLFANQSIVTVEDILKKVPIHLLQFHGKESENYCQHFQRPYMKAIAMKQGEDALHWEQIFASAQALLYDTYSETQAGGTGKVFDWSLLPSGLTKPWVLAGGLCPGNVLEAISQTGAQSIDVSSGVESILGVKDKVKLQALIAGVKRARV